MDRLTEQFIERFFDRWEDYPPDDVRQQWEADLAAAFEATMKETMVGQAADEQRSAIQAQVLAGVRDHLLSDFAINNILGTKAPPYVKDRLRAEIKRALRPLATLNPNDTERSANPTSDVALHVGRLEGALGILEGRGEFNREGLVELLREVIAGLGERGLRGAAAVSPVDQPDGTIE